MGNQVDFDEKYFAWTAWSNGTAFKNLRLLISTFRMGAKKLS